MLPGAGALLRADSWPRAEPKAASKQPAPSTPWPTAFGPVKRKQAGTGPDAVPCTSWKALPASGGTGFEPVPAGMFWHWIWLQKWIFYVYPCPASVLLSPHSFCHLQEQFANLALVSLPEPVLLLVTNSLHLTQVSALNLQLSHKHNC